MCGAAVRAGGGRFANGLLKLQIAAAQEKGQHLSRGAGWCNRIQRERQRHPQHIRGSRQRLHMAIQNGIQQVQGQQALGQADPHHLDVDGVGEVAQAAAQGPIEMRPPAHLQQGVLGQLRSGDLHQGRGEGEPALAWPSSSSSARSVAPEESLRGHREEGLQQRQILFGRSWLRWAGPPRWTAGAGSGRADREHHCRRDQPPAADPGSS